MIEPFTPKQSMQILRTVFDPFFYDKSRQNLFNSQSRAFSVADDFPLFS